MTLAALPATVKGCLSWLLPRPAVQFMARAATGAACLAIVVLSLSRSLSLQLNYGAPMRLYSHLPQVKNLPLTRPTVSPVTSQYRVQDGVEWLLTTL